MYFSSIFGFYWRMQLQNRPIKQVCSNSSLAIKVIRIPKDSSVISSKKLPAYLIGVLYLIFQLKCSYSLLMRNAFINGVWLTYNTRRTTPIVSSAHELNPVVFRVAQSNWVCPRWPMYDHVFSSWTAFRRINNKDIDGNLNDLMRIFLSSRTWGDKIIANLDDRCVSGPRGCST